VELGLREAHPGLGLLTGNVQIDSPWMRAFEVLDDLPWRPQKVAGALRAMRAGIVEVKTRGGVVDPDQVQRMLRGEGDQRLTVFVLRFGHAIRAVITRRADSAGG